MLRFATVKLHARHFDAIDSTMEAAKRWAHDNPPPGLAYVTASTQTAGRGTQGRTWQSPPGNLYMTCLVALAALSRERLAILPLEAGLCLHRLIGAHLPASLHADLWLKWPNDLLLNQSKVAGMLIEVHQGHVLLGLGLNLAAEPEIQDGGRQAGGLAALSSAFKPENRLELAAQFAASLNLRLSQAWSPDLRGEILQAWSQATRWHEPLVLRRQRKQEAARVMPLRLTENGHLEVQHDDGKIETLVAEYLW